MENRRNYIIGFLLIASAHWAIDILTAILTNVVGIFVAYEYVPWSSVFMVIVELFLIYKILNQDRFYNLNSNCLVKLTLTAVLLFLGSHFDYLINYQPVWCGNAFLTGELDGVFETRNKNEFYSKIVGKVLLSAGILYYVIKKFKI